MYPCWEDTLGFEALLGQRGVRRHGVEASLWINFLRKMEEAKTIKVSPRIYAELNAFTGLLSERLKKRVSIDDALEDLLLHARRRDKPGDFASAWVMSDEEEEEIKGSLKELWGTWKMD